MRILITTFALDAHFFGTVPLAWALRAAGHEVRVASQPALTGSVTGAGLTAVPCGSDYREDAVLRKSLTVFAHPEHTERFGADADALDEEFLRGTDAVLTSAFHSRVNNDPMIDDLVDFALAWRPDLVIWEPFTFAGAIAARAAGAAHARLLWGPDMLIHLRLAFLRKSAQLPAGQHDDQLAAWLTRTSARFGLPFDDECVVGQWSIDQMPPSVRLPTGVRTVPVRYIPYNGPAVVPDWLRRPPERPRVCLTLGISARSGGDGPPMDTAEILDSFADLDVEVVATLNSAQLADGRRLPANVRAVDFVPLNVLLPTCSAIVHHGGAGTWATAAAHGVPQIVVPWVWDNVFRAQRVEALGGGLRIRPDALTARGLREALRDVLDHPSFGHGAERLRAEMAGAPSPADVVPSLERLALEHRAPVR